MVQTLVISVLIIAIGMALLCINLLLKKDGRFKSFHIHDSADMRERGIHCVVDQDREIREQSDRIKKSITNKEK